MASDRPIYEVWPMRSSSLLFGLLIRLAIAPLLATASACADTIHFIVGPSNHPPGTHEVAASTRLLQFCVEQARPVLTPGLKTVVHDGWPEDPAALMGARAIVFNGDQFPPVRFANTDAILAQLSRLADDGCGFVAIHYAIGINPPHTGSAPVRDLLNRLFGGFANFVPVTEGGTVPRIMTATIEPTKHDHPVLRGVQPFTLRDEPYYRNHFAPPPADATFTSLATAMLPPEEPREEIVAWSLEYKRGSRGMAIVLPHFYRNWANDDLRKLVLNGIFWAARADVPAAGVPSTITDLDRFQPQALVPPS